MLEQINAWVASHALVLSFGTMVLGWFIPDPWKWLHERFRKLAVTYFLWQRKKLKAQGATDEQIKRFDAELRDDLRLLIEALDASEAPQDAPEAPPAAAPSLASPATPPAPGSAT